MMKLPSPSTCSLVHSPPSEAPATHLSRLSNFPVLAYPRFGAGTAHPLPPSRYSDVLVGQGGPPFGLSRKSLWPILTRDEVSVTRDGLGWGTRPPILHTSLPFSRTATAHFSAEPPPRAKRLVTPPFPFLCEIKERQAFCRSCCHMNFC